MQKERSKDKQKVKKISPPTMPKKSSSKENFQEFSLTVHLALALQKARSENIPLDKEAFCENHGFAMEDVEVALEQMLATMEKVDRERQSYETSLEDKKYELTGWRLPPEEMKLHFQSDLEETAIFEVFDTPKTVEQFSKITGGSSDDELRKYGIVDFVENLFHDTFDEDVAFIIMNAFFWILSYNGDRWLPVRSYAIEMLKLFPNAIKQNFFEDTIFIEEFSSFTKKRLATRGICSLKARPTSEEVKNGLFVIKATDAFYSLLKPLDSVREDLEEYFLDI